MEVLHNSGTSFLFRHRKMFGISLVLGLLLGLGITFFIPKKYLSTAIIYPYNSHTRGELVSNPQFGYEVETEQLLQLMESRDMRDRTIDRFNLQDYYGVDTTLPQWRTQVNLKYIEDVKFTRSKYLSIVINVTLEDPVLAADVANFQVAEVDSFRNSIFETNRRAEFNSMKAEFEATEQKLRVLKDSIYGMIGNDKLLFNFIENLDNENYDPSDFVVVPEMEPMVEEYIHQLRLQREMRTKFEQMKIAMETPLPSVYVIDEAVPSYKKASPSYIINALIGAMLVFLLTMTAQLILNKWRELSANEK